MADFLTIEAKLSNIKMALYYLAQKPSDAIIKLLVGDYKRMGLLELIQNNNLTDSKKYFYKSAKLLELEFKMSKKPLPHLPLEMEKPTMWGSLGRGIPYVFLSDNIPLLYSFFEVIDDVGGDEVRKGYHYNTAYALKYLVLGNREKSQQYIEAAKRASDRKKAKTETGYSDVVQGILDNNPDMISEGVEKNLKYHHRCETGIFKAFCLEATAMVKLAKMYGFEVQTDSSYIHKGLLQHDPDIVFEDIDEVYEALGLTK